MRGTFQRILGYTRKAIEEYDMIQNGDRIEVGISGGKDSLMLLLCLYELKRFIGIDYEIAAVTIDPQFNGKAGDYSAVRKICEERGIEYHIIPTDIAEVVFEVKHEPNPCSLCAKMRRGALHGTANRLGCNKLALGHNLNDAVETFMINLTREGRVGCFAPVSYITRRKLSVIRPLVLAPEKEIIQAAERAGLTDNIVISPCPENGHTARQEMKDLLADLEKKDRGVTMRIFGAMRRCKVDGWAGKEFADYVAKTSVISY